MVYFSGPSWYALSLSAFFSYTNTLWTANKSLALLSVGYHTTTLCGLSTFSPNTRKQAYSSLRVQSGAIKAFPRCSESNFARLRANTNFGYFDKTSYISVLDSVSARALLFLRPRRFGKSLTLSMLEHFHGIQYRDKYDCIFKVCSSS